MEEIVARIFKLLEENNLKPTDLNNFLGLSRGTVSDWKRRKSNPSVESLIKVAEYFCISLDYLLLGDDVKKQNNISNEKCDYMLSLYKQLSPEEQAVLIGNLQVRLNSDDSFLSRFFYKK